MKKINSFKGSTYYLSNYYEAPVTIWGITFTNSEAAFHSAKLKDVDKRKSFAHLNPSQAKRKGRRVQLRHDWEKIKDGVMYDITLAKFQQNEDLREKLLSTRGVYLEEGNWWGDTYWGVCNGVGKNKLGKILMQVREELDKL